MPVDSSRRPTPTDRRRFIAGACAGLITLGLGTLAGCGEALPPLRIATEPWPGYEPLYLARELGELDLERVRLIELLSSADCLQALAAGTIEGAGLTLDAVLGARAEGLDLCVVLVFGHRAVPDRNIDVLAVGPAARSRPDGALGHLVAAHFTALEHMRSQAQDAAYRMAARLHIEPQKVRQAIADLHVPTLDENRELLLPPAATLRATAARLGDVMLSGGLLARAPELDGLFDHRFLPAPERT